MSGIVTVAASEKGFDYSRVGWISMEIVLVR